MDTEVAEIYRSDLPGSKYLKLSLLVPDTFTRKRFTANISLAHREGRSAQTYCLYLIAFALTRPSFERTIRV